MHVLNATHRLLAVFLILAALGFNDSRAEPSLKLLRTGNIGSGLVGGELYIGNELIALTVEAMSNVSALAGGNYAIDFREVTATSIKFDLGNENRIFTIGGCMPDTAQACILLSDTLVNFDSESGRELWDIYRTLLPDSAFYRLRSKVFGSGSTPSISRLEVDNFSDPVRYARKHLSVFNDTFQQIGQYEWLLEERVGNAEPHSVSTFTETYRSTRHIELSVRNNSFGDAVRYRMPIRGGCPSWEINGKWMRASSNFDPFVRADKPPVDYSSSCGGAIPDACLSSVSIGPRCTFYGQCIETSLPCGETGYATAYGEKYCKRFTEGEFSEAGRQWRDATLICLQEELVRTALFESNSCAAIERAAFDSHPFCYTSNGSGISICDFDRMEIKDYVSILSIIDFDDSFSEEGREQVFATLKACINRQDSHSMDAGARSTLNFLKNLINADN